MLTPCLRAFVAIVACAAWALTADAQPAPNGRPTRQPGWECRPSPGNQAPAFAFDPCPGCDIYRQG